MEKQLEGLLSGFNIRVEVRLANLRELSMGAHHVLAMRLAALQRSMQIFEKDKDQTLVEALEECRGAKARHCGHQLVHSL